MEEKRLTRAEAIFQFAADLSPAKRAAFLSEQCGEDSDLRALVETFLARHDDGMGSFLRPPITAASGDAREGRPAQEFSSRIESASNPDRTLFRWGPLEVIGKIGEGGFGETFHAHDPNLERDVALKLLKPESLAA
jgi:hypothetical protein